MLLRPHSLAQHRSRRSQPAVRPLQEFAAGKPTDCTSVWPGCISLHTRPVNVERETWLPTYVCCPMSASRILPQHDITYVVGALRTGAATLSPSHHITTRFRPRSRDARLSKRGLLCRVGFAPQFSLR